VLDTNISQKVLVKRRRVCESCLHRFNTVEILEDEYDALTARIDLADAQRALHALNEIRQVLKKVYGG
jgi:transcriptional regulator NrdR family protein